MSKYRILSIDGGGIRGIITAIILQRLISDSTISGFLNDVDLIAGTSTGGLLALGIANGLEPNYMRDIYEKKGGFIFDDSWIDNLLDIGKITGADYDIRNLEKVLKNIFGQTTLSGLKKNILITTFDLDNESKDLNSRTWKPKIFHNFKGSDSDGNELAYKVGLYTSAAPTYFPSVDGYVDGGVYANNPSMCALAQSQDKRFFKDPNISEVVLLSLGTGTSLVFIKGKEHDWGYAQWSKPLISLMMDGVAGIADYQCKQILGDNYFRFAPVFPADISVPMDDVGKIPYMIDFANSRNLDETIKWIKNFWI